MLVADFAILVAVAIVETGFAHAALHCAHSRQHPPAGTKWQLTRVRAETGHFMKRSASVFGNVVRIKAGLRHRTTL